MGHRKNADIGVFLDGDGKIKQLPEPLRTRRPVLAYLAGKFEPGRIYAEKEVNAVIDVWHTFGDYFILRRLLVDGGYMARRPDGSAYWLLAEQGRKEGTEGWTEKKS
ncbi:hypothetical protein SDC9_200582 [bioreactor metagenome]|uniref:DUF2087 domain-containing protein n=1 Tax=bioreactor metagenome TaxID=1076179 RepID=A0A645IRE7_9ZZZZ